MNKNYNKYLKHGFYSKLSTFIPQEEKILWQGRPDKKGLYLEFIFSPMLLIAIAVLLISLYWTPILLSDKTDIDMIIFFICFTFPLWGYLLGILLLSKRYENMECIITDKAFYTGTSECIFRYKRIEYSDFNNICIKRSFMDKKLGLGDVLLEYEPDGDYNYARYNACKFLIKMYKINFFTIIIDNIPDYYEVYKLITKQRKSAVKNIE